MRRTHLMAHALAQPRPLPAILTRIPFYYGWIILGAAALVGQWFRPRLHLAMGFYALLLSVGFMIAFPVLDAAVIDLGWRQAWAGIGFALVLGLAPLAWLLVRHRPEDCHLTLETPSTEAPPEAPTHVASSAPRDATWKKAMVTPAFWVFALASSLYNLIASGLGLFNEAILAERGFAAGIYHRSLVITALTSLAGNLLGGWLANRGSSHRLMAVAMTLLAAALAAFPHLQTVTHVDVFAAVFLALATVVALFGLAALACPPPAPTQTPS